MLPKFITLSLFLAESANEAPCGRTYPRRRDTAEPEEERDGVDRLERVETEEMSEKHRPKGGQADSAGLGDIKGEGEESLVNGEEEETESRSCNLGDWPVIARISSGLRGFDYFIIKRTECHPTHS